MRNEVVSALVDGTGGGDVALLVCRVVVGAFFAISGAHKLISPTRHQALFETLKASRIPYLKVMSWFVPGVELSAGLGVAFGFLAPLAALGLICILTVAIVTDGLGRIPSWNPTDRSDYLEDVLYLPEVLYVLLLLPVLTMGAGPVSLDAFVWRLLGL
jgi:putative oxidoreductase